MDIGIVILNYNTANDTICCVESIVKTIIRHSYKIYIVDNKSTDNSYTELKKYYLHEDNIKVMETDINGGYSYGNNIGIKEALSDLCECILISNPDVVYYDNAIDSMYAKLHENSQIAVIGPSTRTLDQEEAQLYRKPYTKGIYLCSRRPFRLITKFNSSLRSEYDISEQSIKNNLFVFKGMVKGCSFMIFTDLFKRIDFFDDNIFLYSEEWIIAKKISEMNLLAACDFDAKILHKEAESTSKNGTAFQTYHLYLSAFYYLKYYLHCNLFEQIFYFFQNCFNYILKAIKYTEYRSLMIQFIAANYRLLIAKEKIKIIEL